MQEHGTVLVIHLKHVVRKSSRVSYQCLAVHYILSFLYVSYTFPSVVFTTGAPNQDDKGNYLECHMFIPYGGIGKPRRSDRVFIKLSPDGRVHEAPVIQ